MTKLLSRFWKAFDDIPQATTSRHEWVTTLAETWPAVQTFLVPTGGLSREFGCPSPGGAGCPRKLVKRSDHHYRAICGTTPSECESLDLTRADIGLYAMDSNRLAAALREALGLKPNQKSEPRAGISLGLYGVAAGAEIPVSLLLGSPPSFLPDCEPAAFLVPTAVSLTQAEKERVVDRGHLVLVLDEIIELDENNRLASRYAPHQLFGPLSVHYLPKTGVEARAWVLPPEARWEDLTFRLSADETLVIKFGKDTKQFGPEHFGMRSRKNGRPTTLWILLQAFIQLGGNVGWNASISNVTLKKKKQLLADRLVDGLGIEGDPMPWNGHTSRYEARFMVVDDRPFDVRRRGLR